VGELRTELGASKVSIADSIGINSATGLREIFAHCWC